MVSFGNELAGDLFNIIIDEVRLDYQGIWVNLGSHPTSVNDYVRILPKSEVTQNIKLNVYYNFMPGNHAYSIGTVSIPVLLKPVTDKDYDNDAIWIRSNVVNFSVDGDVLNEKEVWSYGVK
uniref:hypothetical protein n=1 Tax=Scandinavium goeteborgense TaxID=1851514 RepID=UPI00135A9C34|nr:hypothetical protein [Scandinavium goeteborgense]